MAFENEGTVVNKPAAAVTAQSYLLREDRMKDCLDHSYDLGRVGRQVLVGGNQKGLPGGGGIPFGS